jgi:ABC-type nitrate/sulfonate/bicarbonate transport system substrate-binding protein
LIQALVKTLFASSVLLLAALSACEQSKPAAEAPKPSNTAQRFVIALTTQPQSTLALVALKQGYFAAEGLEMVPQVHAYGKAALQAMLEGKADFAVAAETPIMLAIARGDPVMVLANIETSTTNDAVIARSDAGIDSPADLKGKRIGYTPGTTSEFFLDAFLTAQGLTRQEVSAIALKPEEVVEALASKQVDAAASWHYPITLAQRRLKEEVRVFYDQEIYTEFFNVLALQELVRQKPEVVAALLRALIRAEEFVAREPAAAQAIVAAQADVDAEIVKQAWNSFSYQVRLDQNLLITLEDETRWAMKRKLIERQTMPDYLAHIYLDGLQTVKPQAVKMSR